MVDPAHAPVVAILTRAPSSGGKTRLFASLGMPSDPALLTALLLDTLDGAAAPGVQRVVAVTPGEACAEVQQMVRNVRVVEQSDGDLGDRMRSAMSSLFDAGAPIVVLIGSDLPHITPAIVTEAVEVVRRDPNALAIGPALDGGYYLIAASRVPDVFAHIEWGGADVLERTEHAARRAGFAVVRLCPLADVDSIDDLRAVCRSGGAARTAAWMNRHAEGGLK
jgi:rSAM/selenodomain-associated transferase 1